MTITAPARTRATLLPWGLIGGTALGAGAIIALLVGLVVGGGAEAPLLADPGALVRYGLPVAKLAATLGAAGAIGGLLLAVLALAPERDEFGRALDVTAASAALWTVSSAASGFLTFLAIYAQPVTLDPQFGALLSNFLSTRELGQAWLATTLMAAVVTVLCFAVRSPAVLAGVLVVAVAALWPVAQTGHTGGTADHDAAVTAVYLHSVFAAAWVGGLLTIVLARRALADRLPIVLARYSTIALVAFIVVAASGLVSAQLRMGGLDALATPYGALVAAKVAALIGLGAFGAAYRRSLIRRLEREQRPRSTFWIIVSAELALMGIASGLATALARTATPVPQVPVDELADPSPAEILTGAPLPPAFEAWRLATEWDLNLLWALLAGFGAFFYLAGVVRLHRRGDAWPLHRTILWTLGMITLVIVTSSGLAVYEKYLFSVHMLGHMVLSMGIPVMLVLGAPVTLAARAIHARKDGSRGPREWILAIVHSRFAGIVGHPLVASVVFAVSLLVFYYSPLFSWAVSDHLGHQWMVLHFLLSGYLFVNALIGVDPAPYRPPYPIRLIILLATMAFHAFFGLSLITGTGLLLPEWFGAMGREWGQPPLADQQTGGGIAWSVGEIPTLVLAMLVVWSWSRADKRESTRLDRKADRDGDAELEAWNAMLADRARVSERSGAGRQPTASVGTRDQSGG
ncbi:cytochrome c oxidase assembly protein [Microcella humidisoli]|uniref:Bifunctional copper resistance protein CopD/cytochrome c oxidase assembly protein n=1 Tax=Microcella humidisoli TaxID=2963406 RepID=A0ABY5FZA5_9MICO|nr:cytochrome c oxidase assembly protein [Microcella humidisoli]UTT63454.1 bifunctional copper resistance protein CopD/cytochrome c oxidase assembly protein [Microcella humidisoli]